MLFTSVPLALAVLPLLVKGQTTVPAVLNGTFSELSVDTSVVLTAFKASPFLLFFLPDIPSQDQSLPSRPHLVHSSPLNAIAILTNKLIQEENRPPV